MSEAPANSKSVSFAKSLFYGNIAEEMLFPLPKLSKEEAENCRLLLDSIRSIFGKVDSAKLDEESKIPPAMLRELKEMGLFGMNIPESYGGLGLSHSVYARMAEEASGFDYAVAVTLGAHQSIGLKGILLAGTEEQKKKYLPRLATGELVAAFALTEPGSGSDSQAMKTKAELTEDGNSYVLNGQKIWITNGGFADLFTVFAKVDCEINGVKRPRVTAFLVERAWGVTNGPEEKKMGIKSSSTTAIYFDNVIVPKENILGELGKGFKIAMEVLNSGRLGLASGCIGAGKGLIKLAVNHAKQRQQFGKPIIEFGMIQDKISRMMMMVYALECMTYTTTGLLDRGLKDYSVESACCKVFGSEALWEIANESMQIAAGIGYMKEYPFERLMRDSRISMIFEGTNEILRVFIALSGMQGPGEDLSGVAKAIRTPLKSYGIIAGFVAKRVRDSIYGDRLTKMHPILKREAAYVEELTPLFGKAVDKVLRRHGTAIADKEFALKRIANIAILLYAMSCTIARTTMALESQGEEHSRRELSLCKVFVDHSRKKIHGFLIEMDENDDEIQKEITSWTQKSDGYPFKWLEGA
jgi:acyl-CoA dehydrogenase family member 9